jgi:hypothetical protein
LQLQLRAILFAVLGTFGGTVVGADMGILNLTLNSDCKSRGDEGARAMGIPLIAIGFVVVESVLGRRSTLELGCLHLNWH